MMTKTGSSFQRTNSQLFSLALSAEDEKIDDQFYSRKLLSPEPLAVPLAYCPFLWFGP